MKQTKTYENFPFWMVLLSVVFSLSIYVIGAYILFKLWLWFFILYLIYCFWVETRVFEKSCINCYYYGKVCCFGKGKLCSLFFKKGDPKRFLKTEISWLDILPDFLVAIFPLIGGIVLLILNFSWTILLLLIILVVLSFGGNAVIRGQLACKYCKQREIGCPAEKLFNKKKG